MISVREQEQDARDIDAICLRSDVAIDVSTARARSSQVYEAPAAPGREHVPLDLEPGVRADAEA